MCRVVPRIGVSTALPSAPRIATSDSREYTAAATSYTASTCKLWKRTSNVHHYRLRCNTEKVYIQFHRCKRRSATVDSAPQSNYIQKSCRCRLGHTAVDSANSHTHNVKKSCPIRRFGSQLRALAVGS